MQNVQENKGRRKRPHADRMPWFRFWNSTLDNPKVQRLTGDEFKLWINLLCIASKMRSKAGKPALPSNADIAFSLRLSPSMTEDFISRLIEADLLSVDMQGNVTPKDWDQWQAPSDHDKSRDRMSRMRERKVSAKKQHVRTCDASHDADVTHFPSSSPSSSSLSPTNTNVSVLGDVATGNPGREFNSSKGTYAGAGVRDVRKGVLS